MNDREIDQRLKDAAKRSFEGIQEAATFLALFSDDMREDPICLMQMGLAVYLNKPIVLLVPEGVEVPENLLMMARKIEYFRRDPEDMTSLEAATNRLTDWMKQNILLEESDE
jgi:hypothetical protein